MSFFSLIYFLSLFSFRSGASRFLDGSSSVGTLPFSWSSQQAKVAGRRWGSWVPAGGLGSRGRGRPGRLRGLGQFWVSAAVGDSNPAAALDDPQIHV